MNARFEVRPTSKMGIYLWMEYLKIIPQNIRLVNDNLKPWLSRITALKQYFLKGKFDWIIFINWFQALFLELFFPNKTTKLAHLDF